MLQDDNMFTVIKEHMQPINFHIEYIQKLFLLFQATEGLKEILIRQPF